MHIKEYDELKKDSLFFTINPKRVFYVFIVTLSILLVFVLIWAAFATMDDIVKAKVILRPSEVVSSVKCVTSGQVCLKNFSNDDLVNKGDLLFSLDIKSMKIESESYKNNLIQTEQEISNNELLLQTIKTSKLPQIDKNSQAYINSNTFYLENKEYLKQISEARIKLEREKNQGELFIIQQNIDDLTISLEQLELRYQSWKNKQLLNALEKEKLLKQTKESLEVQIYQIDRAIQNSIIFAPISGKIAEAIELNVGDYLLTGEEVLKIIPQNNEKLKVDIYVDPIYIAKIQENDPLIIIFPGLPPSRYGMIETKISLVPADVSYENGIPVFIVEADINNPFLYTKNNQSAKLIPGITGEARIITDKSTVMQMFLQKLDFIY